MGSMENSRTKMICILLPWLLLMIPLLEGAATKREVPMILCGDHLTNALRTICSNGFNKVIKKSGNPLSLFDYVDHLAENEGDILGFKPNFLMLNRRVIRNVAYECCTHGPCNRTQLANYCS